MKKKRPVLWTLAGLVLVFGLALAVSRTVRFVVFIVAAAVYTDLTKPNDPLTRVVRNTYAGGSRPVMLTPQPLQVGEPRAEVEALLAKGKYQPDPQERFDSAKPYPFAAGSLFYRRIVDGAPCQLRYEIIVRYDAQDRLIEATGGENEPMCI